MNEVILVTSPWTVAEVQANFGDESQARRLALILGRTLLVDDPAGDAVPANILLAEKDRHVLAAAVAAKCDYLLTSDRNHFTHLYQQTIEGVYVMDTLAFRYAFQYRVDLDVLAYNFSEATGW